MWQQMVRRGQRPHQVKCEGAEVVGWLWRVSARFLTENSMFYSLSVKARWEQCNYTASGLNGIWLLVERLGTIPADTVDFTCSCSVIILAVIQT